MNIRKVLVTLALLTARFAGPIWIVIQLVKSMSLLLDVLGVKNQEENGLDSLELLELKKQLRVLMNGLDPLDVQAAKFREQERRMQVGERTGIVSWEEAFLLAKLYQVDQEVSRLSSSRSLRYKSMRNGRYQTLLSKRSAIEKKLENRFGHSKIMRIYNLQGGEPIPPDAVYVGRGRGPVGRRGRRSVWDNPYTMRSEADRDTACTLFEEYARRRLQEDPTWLDPLRGKDLVCWCWPQRPCHAEILLRLANNMTEEEVDGVYHACYPLSTSVPPSVSPVRIDGDQGSPVPGAEVTTLPRGVAPQQ